MSNIKDWKASEESLPHFVGAHLQINTPTNGYVPFKLRKYQKNVLLRLQRRDYYIISKARQVGITNMLLALCLWECYFTSGIEILWIGSNNGITNHAAEIFTELHETCTLQSNLNLRTNKKEKKEFSNGSIIRFRAATRVIEPAQRHDMLVIDEAAYVDKIEDIVTEIPFIMQPEPKVLIASTPSSRKDWFDNTFMRALRGQNRFIPMQLDWTLVDDWDEQWRNEQNRILGHEQASNEYDATVRSNKRLDIS